jgi:hypothetical protein
MAEHGPDKQIRVAASAGVRRVFWMARDRVRQTVPIALSAASVCVRTGVLQRRGRLAEASGVCHVARADQLIWDAVGYRFDQLFWPDWLERKSDQYCSLCAKASL